MKKPPCAQLASAVRAKPAIPPQPFARRIIAAAPGWPAGPIIGGDLRRTSSFSAISATLRSPPGCAAQLLEDEADQALLLLSVDLLEREAVHLRARLARHARLGDDRVLLGDHELDLDAVIDLEHEPAQ